MIYWFVGVGGVLGSLFRFLLSTLAVNIWGREFPIGTLLINLSGAFLLGWFSSAFVFPKKLHPNLIAALTTGVIGSYTTFSTFCLETVQLIESGDYLSGMFYVGISLFGGLLLVKLGITLGDQRLKKVVNTK